MEIGENMRWKSAKKIEEIQMEITSSPEWKLFSLRNVLISFERKHWRKGNGSEQFKRAAFCADKDKIAAPSGWFFVTTYCNWNKPKKSTNLNQYIYYQDVSTTKNENMQKLISEHNVTTPNEYNIYF